MAAKKPVPYSNPAWAGYVSAGYGIHYGGAGVATTIAAANKKKKELEAKKKADAAAAKKGKPPHVNTSSKPPGTKDTGTPPPTQPGSGYKWNLPPHKWSLPVKPDGFNPLITTVGENDDRKNVSPYDAVNALGDMEKYRRGRMWWYASNQQDFAGADGKVIQKKISERQFGFQFLWNPDSYSTSIQLNTDINPTPMDRFVGVAGAFPSGESISFVLRLDRTNDFAAFRGLMNRDYTQLALSGVSNVAQTDRQHDSIETANGNTTAAYSAAAEYYNSSFASSTPKDVLALQVKELMELGTVADIEYLYKAINGDNWHNIAGRKTSDIGFLAATLLRIDIGPLSYVGFVNSLSVNHIAFSQDMTPIRTDLTVSMNLMASAGLGQTQNGQNGTTP
jgi:hypothetical protein